MLICGLFLLSPLSQTFKGVITVPAWFDEKQREATMLAAKLAGIDLLQLLPEPTAAAMTYFQK